MLLLESTKQQNTLEELKMNREKGQSQTEYILAIKKLLLARKANNCLDVSINVHQENYSGIGTDFINELMEHGMVAKKLNCIVVRLAK